MTSTASSPRPTLVEKIIPWHLGALLLFTTWAFGGQAPWARQGIAWMGGAGMLLFLWACWSARRPPSGRWHPALRLLWPLWLYDALVIASLFNPGFEEIIVAGEPSLMMGSPHPWLPSAALPRLAAHELWQFNGLLLSSFNLILVLHRRSQVRRILFLMAGNAVVLAVFGSFQKLVGAKGLWFGLVASPNPRFFATFIYYNHWGSFVLLNTAVCLALLFHSLRSGGHRDIWHSPVPFGAVVTLLLALSVPLSASRSCTVLIAGLLTIALIHFALRLARRRRETGRSPLAAFAGLALAVALALGAAGYLARDSIRERVQQTTQQISAAGGGNVLTSRLTLYQDTWRMAREKPWTGWGLESYAHVFRVFNTQRAAENWVWIPFYAEAHNDWLQALAEVGFLGTGLLVLLGLLHLGAVAWRRTGRLVPGYLLGGCGLLLLYAWLEFPFANPAVMLSFCAVFACAIRYAQLDVRSPAEDR